MTNPLAAFQAWRARDKVNGDAKHLVADARRILNKKRGEIPEAVVAELEQSIAAVEAARTAKNLEATQQAVADLDERMDTHLAFARKSTVREYSESIFIAVLIALILRAFVVEAFQIPSGSMIPTLEVGDHIFVSKFAYGITVPFTNKKLLAFGAPHRGDVIVFKYPLGQETDYIKRVVGLPGDKVELRRNEVFINGVPMPRELVTDKYNFSEGSGGEHTSELWLERLDNHPHRTLQERDRMPSDFGPKEIPPNNVFVMGDNRDNSNDSRVWGTVPYELIKGRALIVWWSRGPTSGDLSPGGIAEWFGAIRWRRFFHLVD